jgi:hypothetical protein
MRLWRSWFGRVPESGAAFDGVVIREWLQEPEHDESYRAKRLVVSLDSVR